MRLLNSRSLNLKTFPDRNGFTPEYAILSHCWSENPDDEVLYLDIVNGRAQGKPAYAKLSQAMIQASEKYEWLWCDTCCIDKSSSSELTEAINSMYTWYQKSAVCYAYLEDVTFNTVAELHKSKWFTRGWTLQELLAPRELIFYDRKWTRIGRKGFLAIRDMISERTKIAKDVLDGTRHLQSVSVAQRMSWVAGRKVTRPEDIAYCLMGIFQVNMPMLYGEGGQNAFHRLQQHIMGDSNDHSLFAWTMSKTKIVPEYHGLLADSPDAFAECNNIVTYSDFEEEQPYQQSNSGLRIKLHLTPVRDSVDTFYAALNCPIPSSDRGYYGFLGIRLKKLASGQNQFSRVRCDDIMGLTERGQMRTVYVRQKAVVDDNDAMMPMHFFMPQHLVPMGDPYELMNARFYKLEPGEVPPVPLVQSASWFAASQASSFKVTRLAGKISAVLTFQRKTDNAYFLLALGAISDFEVGFAVATVDMNTPIDVLEKSLRLESSGSSIEMGSHRVRVDFTTKLDVPRKLYLVDIMIDGTAPPPPAFDFRPPPTTTQEYAHRAATDIVQDVREIVAGPDAHRYRFKSLLDRTKKKG